MGPIKEDQNGGGSFLQSPFVDYTKEISQGQI